MRCRCPGIYSDGPTRFKTDGLVLQGKPAGKQQRSNDRAAKEVNATIQIENEIEHMMEQIKAEKCEKRDEQ